MTAEFDGQKRGEIWAAPSYPSDTKRFRLIVACAEAECDNDAALMWWGTDPTPPLREVYCVPCKTRLDEEAEARREDRVIEHHDQERITNLLLGHSVSVDDDEGVLVLDDGTRLEIATANDCCSRYFVESLRGCPNLITAVEFPEMTVAPPGGREHGDETMRIFVLAEAQKINLVEVGGNPGSGYYATGYHFVVTRPGEPAAEPNYYEVRR